MKGIYISFVAVLLALCSCGVPSGQIRITGHYKTIDQGDFFILSPDGGIESVDTLHIRGGEFDYQCDVTGDAMFCIIYPNNSQLPLWMHGGDHIMIKGDEQGTWHVKVTGNEENELYTEFRLQTEEKDTLNLRKLAAVFIRKHPESVVSQYLLCQYFINAEGVPQDSVQTLYQIINQVLPQHPQVATLGGQIQQRYVLQKGQRMPSFDLMTQDSVRHTLSDYKNKTLIMYFWAGWQGTAGYLHREMHGLKEHTVKPEEGYKKADIELLSYSLDMDSVMLVNNRSGEEAEKIPVYCDFSGFSSRYASQIGIRSVPYFVVVGPDGRVKLHTDNVQNVKSLFKE